MSLQDESFPHDAFVDELDLSSSPHPRFQFPHRMRQNRDQQQSTASLSNSSSNTSSSDQSGSCESNNDCAPATNNNGDYNDSKKPFISERQKKSQSCQNIHMEYTKRRYKHVESKVGQYIANMKAEDERRRQLAKFQRHRSMPDALVSNGDSSLVLKNVGLRRYDAIDVHNLDELVADRMENGTMTHVDTTKADVECDVNRDLDSSENMTGITASSSSHSGAHEQSDAGAAADFIDKLAYAQIISDKERLQSYTDYLQMKLDEKISENLRLRQNVDYMRIKLSTCEDKLKRQMNNSLGMMSTTCFGGSMGSGLGGMIAGRQSLQSLLYCPTKNTAATQTEPPPTPPPPPPSPSPLALGLPLHDDEYYVTPEMSDGNNNMQDRASGSDCDVELDILRGAIRNSKNIATIQPMALNFSGHSNEQKSTEKSGLRQRSNSHSQKHLTCPVPSTKSQHSSRTSHPSSNDSAIDFEIVELSSSPQPSRRKRYSTSPTVAPSRSNRYSGYALHPSQHQCMRINHSPQEASPQVRGYNDNTCGVDILNDTAITVVSGRGGNRKPKKTRWLVGFFKRCTRCGDSTEVNDSSALHQTFTHIPLLEGSFVEDKIRSKRQSTR